MHSLPLFHEPEILPSCPLLTPLTSNILAHMILLHFFLTMQIQVLNDVNRHETYPPITARMAAAHTCSNRAGYSCWTARRQGTGG